MKSKPIPTLGSETAQRILAADMGNVLARVKKGEPLSKSQRDLIAKVAEPDAKEPALAKNQSELARILDTTRQLIHWHALKPASPPKRKDGKLDVMAWRKYLADHGRAGNDLEPMDLTEARLKGELLSNWRKEFRNAVLQKEYLPKQEVQRVCGLAIQSAKTRSFSGLPRLVALVRLAKDDESALKAAREEMIAVWRAMESCDWFKPNERAN